MGLDMYAYYTAKKPSADVDFPPEQVPDRQAFHTWRKHPNLHGWMAQLYKKKGGSGDFNLDPVHVDLADLDLLETAIREDKLPHTEGFLIRDTSGEETDDDLTFISEARAHIAAGRHVFYTAWW